MMIGIHGRLFYATLDQAYAERTNTLIQAFAGDVGSHYMQMSTYLNNFEYCASRARMGSAGRVCRAAMMAVVPATAHHR